MKNKKSEQPDKVSSKLSNRLGFTQRSKRHGGEVAGEVQPCNTAFTTTATFIQEIAKEGAPTTEEILDARNGALGLCKNLATLECALTEKCKQVQFSKIVNVELVSVGKKDVTYKMTAEWMCVATA